MERRPLPGVHGFPPGGAPPRRESGVALLIVLVVLFIVAVLMVDIALTASTARQSATNSSSDLLMDAAIEARMALYAQQILFDGGENKSESVNDRWAREDYQDPVEAEPDGDARPAAGTGDEEEAEPTVLGSTSDVTVVRSIEDEERKFNLNLLLQTDKAKVEEAKERLAVLIDRFREDTPFDISRAKAEQLVEAVVKYLARTPPTEGEKGKIPVAGKPWLILTPDELMNVEEFSVDEAYGAKEILYRTRKLEDVLAWEEDPENTERPKEYEGLLRYLTLWSGTAWGKSKDGKPVVEPDSWLRININTAERPVLETIFKQPADYRLVDRILEYREGVAEDSGEPTGTEEGEAEPKKQVFEGDKEIEKVEGLKEALGDPKRCYPGVVAYTGNTFSVHLHATHQRDEGDKAHKRVRFIVRRSPDFKSLTTLLREERHDPDFDDELEKEEEEEE